MCLAPPILITNSTIVTLCHKPHPQTAHSWPSSWQKVFPGCFETPGRPCDLYERRAPSQPQHQSGGSEGLEDKCTLIHLLQEGRGALAMFLLLQQSISGCWGCEGRSVHSSQFWEVQSPISCWRGSSDDFIMWLYVWNTHMPQGGSGHLVRREIKGIKGRPAVTFYVFSPTFEHHHIGDRICS